MSARLQCGVSSRLDSSRWIKLSAAVDDFRFGPPAIRSSGILPAKQTPVPRAQSSVTTKQIPERFRREKHVRHVEQSLEGNPTNLFKNLQSDVPREIYEDLVFSLGLPQRDGSQPSEETKSVRDDSLFIRKDKDIDESKLTRDKLPHLATEDKKFVSESRKIMRRSKSLDPYRSFLKRINYSGEKSNKKSKKIDLKIPVESETTAEQIAEDFCEWMNTIGSQDSEIKMDVNKLVSLFTINTELDELVKDMTLHQENEKTEENPEKSTSPSKKSEFIRYRYGTCRVNRFKKTKPGTSLEDPEMKETRHANELDTELAQLHSYQSFTRFIAQNDLKTPKFLRNVLRVPDVHENVFSHSWLPIKSESLLRHHFPRQKPSMDGAIDF